MVSAPTKIRSVAAKSVKNLLHRLGFTVRHFRKLRANFIVTFHIVEAHESDDLEKAIRFLSQNFAIVPLDELVARIQTQTTAPKQGIVALTFDDGLKSHGDVVYKVLKRLAVPATFYICADLIGQQGSVWTWEIHSRLERMVETDKQHFFDAAGVSGKLQRIVDWMKTIPVVRRERIEKEMRDCTPDFRFTPAERDRFELMSWEQIQTLDSNLITIGSHTSTHVDLPQANPERLERELSRSKEIIESRLNRKVKHFAYPNGSVSLAVLPSVKKYYSSAVTTKPGVVKPGDNPLLLNRVHSEFDLARFSWDLATYASRELAS